MKKYIKRVLLAIVIGLFGYYLFRFFMVTVLTLGTGSIYKDELRPEEIKLFKKFKKELNLKEIERAPEKRLFEPMEKEPYSLYFRYLNCNITKDSLDILSKQLALRVDKEFVLSRNFYAIELVFYRNECNDTIYRKAYLFTRAEINKMKKEQKLPKAIK